MKKFLIPCVMAIVLCSGCSIHTQKEVDELQASYDKKYEDYEDDISDYEDKIDDLESQVSDYETQIADLTEENEELEQQYNDLYDENETLNDEYDELANAAAQQELVTANSYGSLNELITDDDREYVEQYIPSSLNTDLCVVASYVFTSGYDCLIEGYSMDEYYAPLSEIYYDFLSIDTSDFSDEEMNIYYDTVALWTALDDIYYYGETDDDYDAAITAMQNLYDELGYMFTE